MLLLIWCPRRANIQPADPLPPNAHVGPLAQARPPKALQAGHVFQCPMGHPVSPKASVGLLSCRYSTITLAASRLIRPLATLTTHKPLPYGVWMTIVTLVSRDTFSRSPKRIEPSGVHQALRYPRPQVLPKILPVTTGVEAQGRSL
jgi:hypothetical protein